jgi:hypothetical protein
MSARLVTCRGDFGGELDDFLWMQHRVVNNKLFFQCSFTYTQLTLSSLSNCALRLPFPFLTLSTANTNNTSLPSSQLGAVHATKRNHGDSLCTSRRKSEKCKRRATTLGIQIRGVSPHHGTPLSAITKSLHEASSQCTPEASNSTLFRALVSNTLHDTLHGS